MKSFIEFLNEEAKLQGSKGLPSDYLSDVDIKAQRELGIRKDSPEVSQRYFSDIMRLIETGRRLTFGNLTPDQQKQRANDLEELAKEVIYSEYGNMLENVDLDIKMVPYGQVSNEMPEISEVPETPASRGQQQSEMQGLEDDEEEEKTSTDAKSSFLDRLFKKPKKKEEFVGSEEYKGRVDKAKLINNIIQGEAKNTKKILHSELVKQGLERIFGATAAKDIFKVWDDITKVADKLDWIIPIEQKAGMILICQTY